MTASKEVSEVERNALGQVVRGTPNPGGLTAIERAARDAIRQALAAPDMQQAWRAGYLAQLIEQNPLILKDYADRVGGRPKERVELSQDPDAPANPLAQMATEMLAEFALWRAERAK